MSKFIPELNRKPSWSEDHHGHNHASEGRKVAIKIGNHGSRCTRTRPEGVDRHTLVGEESLEDVDSFTCLVGVTDKKIEAWTVTLSC